MSLIATDLKSRIETKVQAISDFPTTGQSPVFIDDRVLQAICEAIQEWIVQTAVIIPDTLNNPSGQSVHVNTGTGDGATNAPQVIAGKGKVT